MFFRQLFENIYLGFLKRFLFGMKRHLVTLPLRKFEEFVNMDPDYPTPLYINPVDYFKGGEHKTETAYTKPIVYGSTLFVTLSLHATYNNLSRRPIISGE